MKASWYSKIMLPNPEIHIGTGIGELDERQAPLPITNYLDHIRNLYYQEPLEERDRWLQRFFSEHQEIKDFYSQYSPIPRTINFGEMYLQDHRLIDQETLLTLIDQYLAVLGLSQTRQALREDNTTLQPPEDFSKSQLYLLAQRAVFTIDQLFKYINPDAEDPDPKHEKFKRSIYLLLGDSAFEQPFPPLSTEPPYTKENPVGIEYNGEVMKALTPIQMIYILTGDSQPNSDIFLESLAECISAFVSSFTFLQLLQQRVFQVTDSSNQAIENSNISENSNNTENSNISENSNNAENSKLSEKSSSVILSIYKFLGRWIALSGKVMDPKVLEMVISFKNQLADTYPSIAEKGNAFLKIIQVKEENRYYFIKQNTDSSPKITVEISEPIWGIQFQVENLPPAELGRQLTMWLWKFFIQIKDQEYLYSERRSDLQPSIVKMKSIHDPICLWISNLIENSKQKLAYFIDVGQYLDSIQNFNGLHYVLSGISLAKEIDFKVLHSKTKTKWYEDTLPNVRITVDLENLRNITLEAQKTGNPVFPFFDGWMRMFSSKLAAFNSSLWAAVPPPRDLEYYTQTIKQLHSFQENPYTFTIIDQAQDAFDQIYMNFKH